jgi:gas vesicle protein
MAVSEADRFLGLSDQDAAAYEREQQRILRESQNSQWEESVPDQGLDIGPENETLPPVRSAPAADPVAGNAPPEELPEWTDEQDAATDPMAADAFLSAPQQPLPGNEPPASADDFLSGNYDPPSGADGGGGSGVVGADPTFSPQQMSADSFLLAPAEGESPDGIPSLDLIRGNNIASTWNAIQRGWASAGMAMEMDAEQPNPEAVITYQQEIQKLAPSQAYSIAMDDSRPPMESWQAFSYNPVGVFGELIGESMAGFARQMANKGVAPMVLWTGAGALLGGPKGMLLGARAGYANAVGLASHSMEMSSGILDSFQRAGIDITDPQALTEGLQDPERMALAREFAEKGAVPVATFDVASALLAGKLVGRQGTKIAGRLAAGAIETAVQSFMGGAGEASKQLAQDGRITSGRSILAETAADSVMGSIDIAVGSRLERARELPLGNVAVIPEEQLRAGDVNVEMGGQTISIPARPRGRTPNMARATEQNIAANAAAGGTAPAPVVPQPAPAVPAAQGTVPPPPAPAPANTNPEQRPRQFEERASDLPNVPEQTQSLLGSVYDVQRFKDAIEAAKAWINDYGLDAARALMTEISVSDDRRAMTPVEIAIAVELAGRLGAMQDYQGQATVLKVVSRKGQTMGAAIAHLKIISMMTPEGIVMYANRMIEDYINTLPPERQEALKRAQSVVDQIGATVAQAKTDIANSVIKEGQFGGERIGLRISRRVGSVQQGEQVMVAIREVLTGPSVKEAAKPQIAKILQDAGLSKGEAESIASNIANQFYKALDQVRAQLIAPRKPKTGEALKIFAQLQADLKAGNLTDAQYMSKVAAIYGVPAMTPELAKELNSYREQIQAATDEEVKTVLAAKMYERAMSIVPQDIWAQTRAVAYLSMLFAPKTWIRNIGGNTIQFVANIGRDAVINLVADPAFGLFTGGRRTSASGVGLMGAAGRTAAGAATGAAIGSIVPIIGTTAGAAIGAGAGLIYAASGGKRLSAMLTPAQDFIKGWKWAAKQNEAKAPSERKNEFMAGLSHLRVMSKLTTQNKWEFGDVKDVNRQLFSGRTMQMLESTLSVALGTADRAFWMAEYKARLAQMEAAAKKKGEWTGQPTPEMIEEAQADAMYAIYQNPNFTSGLIADLRRTLNRNKEFGLGTAIVPFAQVPGSIVEKGFVDWSPLGFIKNIYAGTKGILYANGMTQTGRFDRSAFNKAFAQATVGTGMWMTGLYLYKMGVITASREEDEKLEQMRQASGLGAYQINLTQLRRRILSGDWSNYYPPVDGDTLMDYDWAQPMSIVLAAGAEYGKQQDASQREATKGGRPGERAGWLALSMLAGAKSLKEEPLLQGFAAFNREWSYSGEPISAIYDTALGMPSMFVPQVVRQIAQYNDNIVREFRNAQGPKITADAKRMFMNIGSQLPGVSDSFPPRYDLMGEAVERYGYGGNSFFNVFINPARFTKYKADPAFQELERIMSVTGETKMLPPKIRNNKVSINGQQIELTNEQVAAYRYYLGHMTMGIYYNRLALPQYASVPDQTKVDLFVKDMKDVGAAVRAGLFGHSVSNLTPAQRSLYMQFIMGIGQQMPTGMQPQSFLPDPVPAPQN